MLSLLAAALATAAVTVATAEAEPIAAPEPAEPILRAYPRPPPEWTAQRAYQEAQTHVRDNPGLAVWHYGEACKDGHAKACTELGHMVRLGAVLPPDRARAQRLFRRGCNLEHEAACMCVDKPRR